MRFPTGPGGNIEGIGGPARSNPTTCCPGNSYRIAGYYWIGSGGQSRGRTADRFSTGSISTGTQALTGPIPGSSCKDIARTGSRATVIVSGGTDTVDRGAHINGDTLDAS